MLFRSIIALLFISYRVLFTSGRSSGSNASDTSKTRQNDTKDNKGESTSDGTDPVQDENQPGLDDDSDNGEDNSQLVIHVVKSGENLSAISYKYYRDATQYIRIMEANGLKNANSIYAGQELIIP